jgi:hypothetical protein
VTRLHDIEESAAVDYRFHKMFPGIPTGLDDYAAIRTFGLFVRGPVAPSSSSIGWGSACGTKAITGVTGLDKDPDWRPSMRPPCPTRFCDHPAERDRGMITICVIVHENAGSRRPAGTRTFREFAG